MGHIIEAHSGRCSVGWRRIQNVSTDVFCTPSSNLLILWVANTVLLLMKELNADVWVDMFILTEGVRKNAF